MRTFNFKIKAILLLTALMLLPQIRAMAQGDPDNNAINPVITTTDMNQLIMEYDEDTKVYTFTTTGTDPFFLTTLFTSELPEDSCFLSFDYYCSTTISSAHIFLLYPYNDDNIVWTDIPATSGKTWRKFQCDLSSYRKASGWGKVNDCLRIDLGWAAGVTIKLCNLHIGAYTTEPTAVEGDVDDGYYYINMKGASGENATLVPANDGETWRLGAYERDNSEFDASYVWHITKNADGTHNLKNCGPQELTYVENITKGSKASPYVLMTGTNPARFTFQRMSDGSYQMYSTDNDYNYGLNTSTGYVWTQTPNSRVTIVPVDESNITNSLKLQEAITTALGYQFTVGTNPGEVSQTDYDAFAAVLEKANAKTGSNDDNSALIAGLNAATQTLLSKVIQIEDGYYTFENCASEGDYLTPYFGNSKWYLGHEPADITIDYSAIWHATKNADGNVVLKSCGTQDSTYIVSASSDYEESNPYMAGTSKTFQTFRQEYANRFKIYSGDNLNPISATAKKTVTSANGYYGDAGIWKIVKLTEDEIPFMSSLNEAITDARGTIKDSKVGGNPGDNYGDASELDSLINVARDMYDEATASDSEVEAMIAKLRSASESFLAQDHSMRGIDDGYYYIVSTSEGFQEKGKIALYVPSTQRLSWKVLQERDPLYIFYIKNLGDGTFSVQNTQNSRYIGSNTSDGIATTATQEVAQNFAYQGDGLWQISNDADGTYYRLQTNETELSGEVNTTSTSGICNWELVRIYDQALIDSISAAGPQAAITGALQAALNEAEPAYKGVFKYTSDHSNGLLKETDEDNPRNGQIWAIQEPTAAGTNGYSSFANIIDGDLKTCFQATWNSSLASAPQPFQVDLRDNPVSDFEFYFGLRDNADHWGWVECWADVDIYATNDSKVAGQDDLDATQWHYVGNFNDLTDYLMPEDASKYSTNRYIYYKVNDLGDKYRYIRFMINHTIEDQGGSQMYTLGEFQVYELVKDTETSPYYYIEELRTAADQLKVKIDEAKEAVASNTATQEQIDAIKKLTETVLALTPSTTELDKRIAEVTEYVNLFSDEGNWGDVSISEYSAMAAALEEAADYDHVQPVQSDLDARLAALNTAFALFKSQQKLPETNTWYYITNTDNSRVGYTDEGGTSTSEYSRWCYGNAIMAPRNNATGAVHWVDRESVIRWGGYTRANEALEDSVLTDPYSMWRLVKFEGAANNEYALQNRATGRYMGLSGNKSGCVGLHATPVGYSVELLKSGQFLITCTDSTFNSSKIPLHADGTYVLVSWDPFTADSPSSWTFEPIVNDVKNLELSVKNDAATIITLPYAYDSSLESLNANNNIVTYTIKGISDDGTKLQLTKKTEFEAGEPMIVIAGNPANHSDESGNASLFLPLINEFSMETKQANGLVGTLDYTQIADNAGLIKGTSVVAAKEVKTALDGQRGYIDLSKIVNDGSKTTDYVLDISENIINGITAISTISGKVNVYTTDGVLIKSGAKAPDAKSGLKKGVYIIGKQKVLVK